MTPMQRSRSEPPDFCRVRGRLLLATGQPAQGTITFVPRRVGYGAGGVVLPAPVQLTLRPDGAFEVHLAPSASPYTVRTPAGALVIDVPRQATAEFADLVVRQRP